MKDLKRKFNVIADSIIDILFPPRCIYCSTIISSAQTLEICEDCANNNSLIDDDNTCSVCGQRMGKDNVSSVCVDCNNTKHYFEKNYSPLEYSGKIKNSILRFKFAEKKRYAYTFGKLIVQKIRAENHDITFDSVVYIPMNKKAIRERGYNQAHLLAQVIAKEIDCELIKNALIKTRQTLPQRELTRHQRQKNIKNAFDINKSINIKEKTILIVDDIYTTGATINECSKVLINNGAKKVYSATIAVGKGFCPMTTAVNTFTSASEE
jgi:ComF family protein